MKTVLCLVHILFLFLTGITCRHTTSTSEAGDGDGSLGNQSDALHSLQKRFQIQINLDPSLAGTNTETILNRALDECITLAQLVVDHVQPDHEIFLRFFGSNQYYTEIMSVYRTIAGLRMANNDQTLTFNVMPGRSPEDTDNEVNVAAYDSNSRQGGDTRVFTIFEAHLQESRALGDILPSAPFPGQLNSFDNVAARIIFHELVHMAGDGVPIVDETEPDVIVDSYLFDFQDGSETDQELLHNVDVSTQAYREEPVLILPQLSLGAIGAALNADSYTLMAIAAWIGWTANTRKPIVKPPNYDDADHGDPYKNAKPPPSPDSGSPNRYASIFGMIGRIGSDL